MKEKNGPIEKKCKGLAFGWVEKGPIDWEC